MDLITQLIGSTPISALSLAAIVVVIIFQMAQMGIIDIRIGKKAASTPNKRNREIERQVDSITDDVNSLKEDVKNIKENHLAHIQEDMARIREDVSFIKGKLDK